MNNTIIQIWATDQAPSGWSATPMSEIVCPDGFITDVVFMASEGVAQGWVKRGEGKNVIIGGSQPDIIWAYRFVDENKVAHIVGDMELWYMWEGLHDYQY